LIEPASLPHLFKESLSGEIISSYVNVISEVYFARCVSQISHSSLPDANSISLLFSGEIEKGVVILEQLSKVSRFDLVKMFLSSTQAEGTFLAPPMKPHRILLLIDFKFISKDVQKVLRKLKSSDKADEALKARITALEKIWMS
jgi:hypothetical protein